MIEIHDGKILVPINGDMDEQRELLTYLSGGRVFWLPSDEAKLTMVEPLMRETFGEDVEENEPEFWISARSWGGNYVTLLDDSVSVGDFGLYLYAYREGWLASKGRKIDG